MDKLLVWSSRLSGPGVRRHVGQTGDAVSPHYYIYVTHITVRTTYTGKFEGDLFAFEATLANGWRARVHYIGFFKRH
eukprot:COSAG05_NODE_759_length_7489_cov_110.169959_7_plen_77_part_00